MKVEIIDSTVFALEMLIYTKQTRLQGERSFQDVVDMPYDEKIAIYEGMKDTIQSPFEFVDFTFLITGVSRSFTHQLVRTRNASYAQESLRAVKPTQGCYDHGNPDVAEAQEIIMHRYEDMVKDGVPYQEAREMLPTGVKTSILMKVNLRELAKMAEVRLCTRTAGEYQQVFKMMKAEVVKIYPWLEDYIEVYCVKYGICCFPRYEECPVRAGVVQPSMVAKENIKLLWRDANHVADPSIR